MAILDSFLLGSLITTFRDVVTMPLIAFILLSIFFLGLIYQLFSENFNLLGLLSFLSIIVFYAGHLLVGDYNGLSLSLFILGMMFIIIEFFVIGAILGILGGLMLLFSILLVSDDMLLFSIFLATIILLALVEWVIFVKFKKKKIPFLSRLILEDATDKESGYTSFDDRSYLLGEAAKTVTPLRPSGTIKFGDQRIDAVAEGAFIEGNVDVKVIHVEGTRVVVRPLEE
ncbi:NfeD family protein [Salinicoccus siamensis]|uniref:NfeD family protein n=2 Tax=Salinicoccus TaxID=45669 RepID=A0ABV5Z3N9_9STAP